MASLERLDPPLLLPHRPSTNFCKYFNFDFVPQLGIEARNPDCAVLCDARPYLLLQAIRGEEKLPRVADTVLFKSETVSLRLATQEG